MRINARLEDSYEDKFLFVQKQEHKNRTDILKEALDQYFARKLRQEEQTAWEKNQRILKMLSGIGSGPEDLSTNYKDYVYQGLKEKHGID